MHVNNRMFAYYDQTFDLILPITDKYIDVYYICGSCNSEVR